MTAGCAAISGSPGTGGARWPPKPSSAATARVVRARLGLAMADLGGPQDMPFQPGRPRSSSVLASVLAAAGIVARLPAAAT